MRSAAGISLSVTHATPETRAKRTRKPRAPRLTRCGSIDRAARSAEARRQSHVRREVAVGLAIGALSVAGSVGGRDWIAVGRFLGPNISEHYRRYSLRWTVQAWRDAGMTDVGVREMSLGGGLVMWGTKSRV